MRRTHGTLALALATLALVVGCSKKEKEEKPVVTVQTATARKAKIELVITAEGVLFPKNQAAITPKIAAPVHKFYVNRGSKVHAGQLLAVLENRDLAASVTENKGALEQAQAAYETTTRASLPEDFHKAELDAKAARESYDAQQKLYDSRQELFKQGALPRKDLDQAAVALVQAREASLLADQHLASMQQVERQQTTKSAGGQLTSAQGKYAGAAAQLSYTELRSPINGVVTDRPIYAGETPPQGGPILTVMDVSTVIARVHIPQDQAALLKPGDAATVSSGDADPIPAKVTLVSPALDAASTTVEVWIEAVNKDGALRPGSTAEVKIVAKSINNAITIPAAAVVKTPEGKMTVMVVDKDSVAQQTEVETGIANGDDIQITKGLNPGQVVVTTGAYGLPDKTQVKTAAAEPADDKDDKGSDSKDKKAKPSAEKD